MNSDDFDEDITLKLYLKYKYQAIFKGLKREEKKAFLRAININLNYLYSENLYKKKDISFFIFKKVKKKKFSKRVEIR